MKEPMKELVCPALQLRQEGVTLAQPIVKGSLLAKAMRTMALWYLPGGSPAIPESPDSIVLVTGGNLGGTILTLPLAEAVRRRFPDAHLTIACNTPVGKEFMETFGPADEVHVVSSTALKSPGQFGTYLRTLRRIWKNRPDLLISNHDSHIDPFLIPLRIPVRVGHVGTNILGNPLRWSRMHNAPVQMDAGMNWLESYRDIAKRLDSDLAGPPKLNVSDAMEDRGRQLLASQGVGDGERCVAIQAGVWKEHAWRQWPMERFVELCRILWRDHELRPVLLGDAGGVESAAQFQSMAPDLPVVSLVNQTSVEEAAGVITQCAVSVCNDSGLMHFSAAVGTPTVGIYGMTNPAETWCYEPPHRIARRDDCLPCYHLDSRVLSGCEHRKCLTELDPETVRLAVAQAIN